MASSTTTSKASKTYTPSIASTSTSTSTSTSASTSKPSASASKASKRSAAILSSAKRLLSDIGSSPTAAYDREQAAKGQQTDSQKAFAMPRQMPRRT